MMMRLFKHQTEDPVFSGTAKKSLLGWQESWREKFFKLTNCTAKNTGESTSCLQSGNTREDF